jgi:hypothetical protein
MRKIHQAWSDLSRFFKAATPQQLVKYFDGNEAALKRAIKMAQTQGLIECRFELIRAREVSEPIATVSCGELLPRAEEIAYTARQRWGSSFSPTLIISGTTKLAALSGGTTSVLVKSQISHEVALTDVFLKKRESNPSFSWSLVTLGGAGGARVDAIAGNLMVELVGQYSGGKVAAKMELAGNATIEFW